jgi:hypothetical protein
MIVFETAQQVILYGSIIAAVVLAIMPLIGKG